MFQLPQNTSAEQSVLGCILKDRETMNDVIELLTPNDFYVTSHNIIYKHMLKLYRDDIKIDTVTLANSLNTFEKLKEIGGISYLMQLQEGVLRTDNILSYTEIIKEKSMRRDLLESSKWLVSEVNSDKDIKLIINTLEDKLYNISTNKAQGLNPISVCIEETLQTIEENYVNGGGIIGESTGFKSLDNLTSGLVKGDFILIAARPSMGKTAFSLNIAQYASRASNVAIFSLEMPREQLTQRLLTARTFIELQEIRSGKLNDEKWTKITNSSAELSTRKLFIDDTAGITVNEIKAKCKKLKLQQGLDLVVIDYLQLIESSDSKNYSREQEVSKISRSLKKMAKELGITVIALSQLSRAPEQRADHRPILSDLRESGAIEQDADIIMMLYRDDYYNKESENKNLIEIIINKNRNGELGTVNLAWVGKYQRFAELDYIGARTS